MPRGTGGAGLTAVWGTGPQDVFAVGYTAISCAMTAAPGQDGQRYDRGLRGIWGAGPDNVFAVGRMRPSAFQRYSWSLMSGGYEFPHGRLGQLGCKRVRAGFSPRILHNDGSAWVQRSAALLRPLGIWAVPGAIFRRRSRRHHCAYRGMSIRPTRR